MLSSSVLSLKPVLTIAILFVGSLTTAAAEAVSLMTSTTSFIPSNSSVVVVLRFDQHALVCQDAIPLKSSHLLCCGDNCDDDSDNAADYADILRAGQCSRGVQCDCVGEAHGDLVICKKWKKCSGRAVTQACASELFYEGANCYCEDCPKDKDGMCAKRTVYD